MPPRDGDADYVTPERIVGPILTNITGVCEDEEDAEERIVLATQNTGCSWLRHANAKMGWRHLISSPEAQQGPPNELMFSTKMWPSGDNCDNPPTNSIEW